jgi:hypothetical protein
MVDAAQPAAARRRWWPLRRRRRDLRAVPFPEQALQQWQDPEVALALLYRHAEGRAIDWVFEFQSNLVQLEASAGRAAWAGARPRPQGPREGDAPRAPAAEPPVPASSPPPAR